MIFLTGTFYNIFKRIVLAISLSFLFLNVLSAQDKRIDDKVYEIKDENIIVRFILNANKVKLTEDILLSIEVIAPSNTSIKTPNIEDRIEGFTLSGSYSEPPLYQNGKVSLKYHYRLTPLVSEEYRIKPMAIVYSNTQENVSNPHWLQTPVIKLLSAPLSTQTSSKSIRDIIPPLKVYPSKKIITKWILIILASIAGLIILLWFIRYIHLRIKIARMSPRERALYELRELIKENLIAKGKIKDFYLELTMIVRRYIERAHRIRAPELTTEEFLQAATQNPHFSKVVIEKLKTFLETSDLVKFAAYRPDQKIIDDSLRTAEDYIKTDEATTLEKKGVNSNV